MIEYNIRKKGPLKIENVFFGNGYNRPEGVSVGFYLQNSKSAKNCITTKTSVVDLTQSEEDIHANFAKRVKKNLKQAEKYEDIECFCEDHPDDTLINEYFNYFREFTKARGLYVCDEEMVLDMRKSDSISIAGVRDTESGELLISILFIRDKVRTRMLYSASVTYKYQDDSLMRRKISSVNRYLIWHCMRHFKEMGYKEYDLGGVTLDENRPEMKGIDDFKLEFGGGVVEEYECYYGYTLLGKLAAYYKNRKLAQTV